MSIPLRIFLGSSSEGQKRAEVLQELIYRAGEPDVQVRAWWHKGAFPSGKTYIESLCAIMAETDVGIFVATPDDQVVTRGSQRIAARDNVVFELGWSIGSHSRTRSAIVTIGDSKLPSDLDGVNRLSLRGDFAAPDFIDRNLIAMRSYLDACRQEIERAKSESKTILPKLHEAIARVIARFQAHPKAPGLDEVAAAVVESVASQFSDDKTQRGITDWVCRTSAEDLRDATAIWALDVLGPSAWLTPTAFRYLAVQIREYFRRNAAGGGLPLNVSTNVVNAIRRAHNNVLKFSGRQGVTKFDDQLAVPPGFAGTEAGFRWVERKPELEFVRVLLWTREEFQSPVAESVISIHESFHVPLFGLILEDVDERRAFDFIAFRQSNNELKGFYNRRKDSFVPGRIVEGCVKGHGSCENHWNRIFEDAHLMFAADIHQLLVDGNDLKGVSSGRTP